MSAGAASWRLALTFWVGGLWLLHFVVLPAMTQTGLAPLLVEEVANLLRPLLVAFSAFCAVLQLLVLWWSERFSALWCDRRGQLLLVVLVVATLYFAVWTLAPDALRWLLFGYLVLALCGVLLVLQPVPGGGAR